MTTPPPEDARCGNCFWREKDGRTRNRVPCYANPPAMPGTSTSGRRPMVRADDPPCRHWTPRRTDR